MARYGFRLFEVELREKLGRKARDFSEAGGEHYGTMVERLLKTRLAGQKLVGYPSTGSDEDGSPDEQLAHRNKPALLVDDVLRTGTVVRWRAQYGRYSDFDIGLGLPGAPDADLRDVAPTRGFRVVLNLPAKGTKGVLAVEDISRSCPVVMLARWLKQVSQDDVAHRAAEAFNKGGTKYEDEATAIADAPWWRLAAKPMADEEHLRKLIEDGKLERIQLIRKGSSVARTPDTREMELTIRALSQKKQRDLDKIVTRWFQQRSQEVDGPPPTDAEGAKDLSALLGEEVEALGFDDGYVVINDGSKKQISPSRLSDYFVYALSNDRQPSDLAFYEAVGGQHKRIARATQTDGLEWPSIL
ncbi:MAG TPA: hypothetical protein VNA20_16205 [Frankiaceae bacterium]|nr:hypothetical protein [Frankiaceae bacterium]